MLPGGAGWDFCSLCGHWELLGGVRIVGPLVWSIQNTFGDLGTSGDTRKAGPVDQSVHTWPLQLGSLETPEPGF